MKQFRKLNFIVECVFFSGRKCFPSDVIVLNGMEERVRASLLTKLQFFSPPSNSNVGNFFLSFAFSHLDSISLSN
jgi:hypothetical protein